MGTKHEASFDSEKKRSKSFSSDCLLCRNLQKHLLLFWTGVINNLGSSVFRNRSHWSQHSVWPTLSGMASLFLVSFPRNLSVINWSHWASSAQKRFAGITGSAPTPSAGVACVVWWHTFTSTSTSTSNYTRDIFTRGSPQSELRIHISEESFFLVCLPKRTSFQLEQDEKFLGLMNITTRTMFAVEGVPTNITCFL